MSALSVALSRPREAGLRAYGTRHKDQNNLDITDTQLLAPTTAIPPDQAFTLRVELTHRNFSSQRITGGRFRILIDGNSMGVFNAPDVDPGASSVDTVTIQVGAPASTHVMPRAGTATVEVQAPADGGDTSEMGTITVSEAGDGDAGISSRQVALAVGGIGLGAAGAVAATRFLR